MRVTYLGTATMLLEIGGLRLLTDPAFDPPGTGYDFGPWYAPRAWFASQKTYATPLDPTSLGAIDAVLLSHDHHADNLDAAGRTLLTTGAARRVITTVPGARRLRLGDRGVGLRPGASTRIGGVTITATPARHGPPGTPRVNQVIGFLVEAPGEPRIWISGDTVLHPALSAWLDAHRGVDVAVVHCGGVTFPRVPILRNHLFTFNGVQAAAACKALAPSTIVPVHRDGWTHFCDPVDRLLADLDAAGLAQRTKLLALGEVADLY
jgi:L-ascorbate metabolism protein UlaG (beta-lactamase superfamily)